MILDICELLMVGVVKNILEILSRRSQAEMHCYIYIHCVRCCDIISWLMLAEIVLLYCVGPKYRGDAAENFYEIFVN